VISFIVPAYNEERLIGRTLDSLRAAGGALEEPFEIIVADDASTDGTARLALARGARVVSVKRRQIAATRNAGARKARGDLLLFVDADTVAPVDTVLAAVAALRAGAVGGGASVTFDGRLSRPARVFVHLFMMLYRGTGFAAGCFIFATRQAFEAAGGFDERVYGAEEVLLSWKLRRRGRFVLLREPVLTSGRKLRAYSAWELVSAMVRLTPLHLRGMGSRKGLDLWYGPRRDDPDPG
jgi:cellulose synthase/poly-beta-1,6-N-acetylglucosamine synthase-like glycosyltransferase